MYLDYYYNNNMMSCILKKEILIPRTVTVKIYDYSVSISGGLGVLTYFLPQSICIQHTRSECILIYEKIANKNNKSLIGTIFALINGMIIGVTVGFTKKLQLVGIGYRVIIVNNVINLAIGLSHTIDYLLPVGITAVCPSQTEIVVSGINKQLVGQVAADLRAIHPPEPFKGKGIRYVDEIVYNKDTKKR